MGDLEIEEDLVIEVGLKTGADPMTEVTVDLEHMGVLVVIAEDMMIVGAMMIVDRMIEVAMTTEGDLMIEVVPMKEVTVALEGMEALVAIVEDMMIVDRAKIFLA